MEKMLNSSHLSGSNSAYVEELYEQFLINRSSVPDEWRDLFDSFSDSKNTDISHASIKRDFENLGKVSRYKQVLSNDDIVNSEHESKQVQVLQLISSYPVSYTHLRAHET